MKKISNKSYFSQAFVALAFMGALSACVDDAYDVDVVNKDSSEFLAIYPTVADSQVKTRATASDPDLKEDELVTLDVFVEGVTDASFWKQYHLTIASATKETLENKVHYLLEEKWREAGYKSSDKYNVYVAVNNPLTTSSVANVTALKALTYNEVTAGVATIEDGNIGWKNNDTSGDIYKLYSSSVTGRAFTNEKQFMMDGVIKNWSPDASQKHQDFNVDLNRAAAKIVLNVKFDADFVKSLTHTKKVEGETVTWEEKPAEEQVTITGTPAWKFYNFAFGAPVFAPDTAPTAGVEVHNSGFNIFHNESIAGGTPFTITTYSYPNKWTDTTDAPSIVISLEYTQNGVKSYNYYRIPIVAKDTKSFDRNTIYVIDATIATRGSESHEDVTEIGDLQYEVLPWNDESNSDAISNNVESVQHYYFKVNPKVYTLRGDGEQSVVLNYLKASGTKVSWKLFQIDETTEAKGAAVASTDANAVWGWFYDANGDMKTSYNDNSGTDWSHMGVDIQQSTEGTSGSNGTVTVTSTALNNKAIKYMLLRVYLDEVNDKGEPLEGTYHEDIIIRHFPTDNIQNIAGLWSSYHGTTSQVTLTTTDLSEAQAWAAEHGVEVKEETINATDYIDYATYTANASDTEHYHIVGPTASNYNAFHNAIQSETNRQAANSQENAVADGGEGTTYYWGTNPQVVHTGQNWYGYNNQYDYRTGSGNGRQWYKYQNYYSVNYTHTYSYTQYSVTYSEATPSTWVDWEKRGSHSPQRTYSYTYPGGGQFLAKLYYNGALYRITETGAGGGNYTTERGTRDNLEGLNNNHMYVIQISSTSDEYILGRPYVNQTTHQSQDDVVSPAFMIASQLGAVTTFGQAGDAATHCSRYMEVTPDGKRYDGWRLPTPAEISVITGYQYGTIAGVTIPSDYRVLSPVLTGRYYWSLSGQLVQTRPENQYGNYLRCVRDLSAQEVDELNGFDAIQAKYRN